MMIGQISEIIKCKHNMLRICHFQIWKKSMIIIRLPILEEVSRFSSERSITGSPQGVTTGSKAVTHHGILMYAFNWPQHNTQPWIQKTREFRSLTGAVQQNTMGVYELEILKMMRIKIYICEWWKLMLRPANNYYLFIIIFLPCHCHYHCVVNNNVTIGNGTISTI